MNKYEKGKEGEAIVKRKLRQRGYRVADVSQLPFGCDLVVEKKFRVEVKSTTKPKSFTATLYPEKFDVLCIVVLSPNIAGFPEHTFFIKSEKVSMFRSPTREHDYYFSGKNLGEHFTNKPSEVFGRKDFIKKGKSKK